LPEGATPDLQGELAGRIRKHGPISFREFMDLALYHPRGGYYSAPGRHRVGQEGDFITSVSVGSTFGRLLAHRIHQFWAANRCPDEIHLLEPGPEGGDLALDILGEAKRTMPGLHEALHYHACEPAEAKRAALAKRFHDADEPRAQVLGSPDELDPAGTNGQSGKLGKLGIILANEVLDALPVHLVRFDGGQWHERCVTSTDGQFAWELRDMVDGALAGALAPLGTNFPDAYDTEICLEHPGFLAPLAAAFEHALFIFIDYGFPRHEYYHPSRTDGTLRTYARHQAGDDPLATPGQQDLSVHVDFTRLLASARALGLTPHGFTRQERYLTARAEPLLTKLPPDSPDTTSFIRQFRTLTHPGMLGAAFHILEFTKGPVEASPEPFRFDPQGLQALTSP
jgi:SAM-dependent MidA family methyltransferase